MKGRRPGPDDPAGPKEQRAAHDLMTAALGADRVQAIYLAMRAAGPEHAITIVKLALEYAAFSRPDLSKGLRKQLERTYPSLRLTVIPGGNTP